MLRNILPLLLMISLCLRGSDVIQRENTRQRIPIAVNHLPAGWTHDVLYQNTLSSPVSVSPGDSGIMYILDRSRAAVFKLNSEKILSPWASTLHIPLDSIAWDSYNHRLLSNSNNLIYTVSSDDIHFLGMLDDQRSTSTLLVDPRDGSIYTSTWEDHSEIRHFDSDLHLIQVLTTANYCLNMALDTTRDLLYFTEAAENRVMALNLRTGSKELIRSNLGTGAPDENLGVAVDNSGLLYYSSLISGVFRYNPSLPSGQREKFLMNIPLGVGSINWWSAKQTLLQNNVFVGTLVSLNPDSGTAELLEPNVNTDLIAADSNGIVFLFSERHLYKLEKGTLHQFGDEFEYGVNAMTLDHNDLLYVPFDYYVSQVDRETGETSRWLSFDDSCMITDMEYDFQHREMVVLMHRLPDSEQKVFIARASIEKNSPPVTIAEIDQIDSIHSTITIDRSTGTIYYYDPFLNEIDRVIETDGTLERVLGPIVDPNNEWNIPAGLNFFSPLEGILVTYIDQGRFLLPLDGSQSSVFNNIASGMDNQQGYEDSRGYFYGTNAGVVYLIRPMNIHSVSE